MLRSGQTQSKNYRRIARRQADFLELGTGKKTGSFLGWVYWDPSIILTDGISQNDDDS
jgi:putative NADH-flavin reductase